MQLRSLPSYFRSDQPTRLGTDSPFPPLKVQHRYRGVYERAGFDVNLASPTESTRLRRVASPASQTTSTFRQPQQLSTLLPSSADTSYHSTAAPPDAYANPRSAPLPPSAFSAPNSAVTMQYQDIPYGQPRRHASEPHDRLVEGEAGTYKHEDAYGKQEAYEKQESYGKREAYVKQEAYENKYEEEHDAEYPPRAQPETRYQQFQSFQPANPHPRTKNATSQEDLARNKKHLKLDLTDSNFLNHNSTEAFSDNTSPTFDDSAVDKNTPTTSASSSGDFGRKNSASSAISVQTTELTKPVPYPVDNGLPSDRNLSSLLNGFKLEVLDHKNYDPRAKTRAAGMQPPNNSSHNHTTEDLTESSQDDISFRFASARHSAETAETSNDDYENFLQTSAHTAKPVRHSQLSTISSIISKPGQTDNEDDEVEQELERQLASLKTGSEVSLASRTVGNESFVTALNLSNHSMDNSLPVFKISDASTTELDEESDNEDNVTETEAEFSHSTAPSPDSSPELDEVAPLSYSEPSQDVEQNMNGFPRDVPETPSIGHPHFDACNYETPETIKPLSPKNHRVEEELKDINFKYNVNAEPSYNEEQSSPEHERENAATQMAMPMQNGEIDDSILSQNPTPLEFDAFPKSVIATNYPSFRTSGLGPKCAAGEGPCRSCNAEIDPHAKGLDRAVYSKTGELSGQWHRGCFSCAYNGCSIQFSKKVVCYALLDNAFCHHHYHSLNGSLCQTCHVGIEGECIENELKQRWHLSCLQCTHCRQAISKDYYLVNGAIVCEKDAGEVIKSLQKSGAITMDKVEKRRTRMMFIDQLQGM